MFRDGINTCINVIILLLSSGQLVENSLILRNLVKNSQMLNLQPKKLMH